MCNNIWLSCLSEDAVEQMLRQLFKKTKQICSRRLAERISLFLRRTVMEISSRGGFSGFLVDFV